ncbi:condensation domain-containing protein, partial [Yoonia sp. R2-816]|uniref:condensation domain-containing protein n=1 Tax=Yoonia sp. R2-816 TaxID=3342638 RepID=UPI003727138D
MTYLPFGWERLWLSGALPDRVLCHARVRPVEEDGGDSNAGVVPEVRLADLSFYDLDGRPLGGVTGFSLKRAPRAALLSASERIEDLLYEVVWRGVTPAADDAADEAAGPVLLVDGGDGSGPVLAAIADGLTARGVPVVTGAGEDPARLLGSVPVPAGGPQAENGMTDDGGEALAEPDLGGPGLGGIVYVAPAGAAEEDEADPAEASSRRLARLLGLVQEAVSSELSLPLGLTVVTAGGVAAVPGEAVDPAAASLWGFVRSVQAEQPGLGLRLVDIEPSAAAGEKLIGLLAGGGPEPQLALRGGQFMAPRLGRTTGFSEASLTLRPDRSYLITGGLGALGLEAGEWLARSGAGHVVLAGRRAPDTTVQERLAALEAETGCVVATARLDVSDGDAVAALVGRFAANDVPTDTTEERTVEAPTPETPWPPLAGVIHAAGVLDDGVVTAQTGERLAGVLGPKARGAWHLHEESLDLDLDLFVLYSSVAATLGASGQSNYAAANGFLDGLAAHRQSLGLAATSVAWGPWSSGMTEDATVKASVARQGLRPLSAGPAHGALERLLAGGRSFGVVLDANWRRMGEGLGSVRPAMLSGLLAAPTGLYGDNSTLLARLRETPAGDRKGVLVAFLQDELRSVLRLGTAPAPSAGLFDLGMDSLMAVELRNRLNAALGGVYEASNTVAFDHPTVDKLARHLTDELNAVLTGGQTGVQEIEHADRSQPIPATAQQKALWLLDQLDPAAGVAYNVWVAHRITGGLDHAALQKAAESLVRRHESLRTRLVRGAAGPLQVIDDAETVDVFQSEDWSGNFEQPDVAAYVDQICRQRIALDADAPVGIHLITLDGNDHVLLIKGHHTVLDGASFGVLFEELTEFYSAYRTGSAPDLPPLPIQYADYAIWLSDRMSDDAFRNGLDYWRQSLAGAPPMTSLPSDRPRPVVMDYQSDAVAFDVPPDQLAALKALARSRGATLFMVLEAALAALISRLSGVDDLVLGTVVSGRSRAEFERQIGYFVNAMPLRHRVDPLEPFEAFLDAAKATVIDAFQHDGVPFASIVEAVSPARSPDHSPLFQVMLVLQAPDDAGERTDLRLPGTVAEIIAANPGGHFELLFNLTETGEGLVGRLSYASQLFDRETAERLVSMYGRVLDAVVSSPETL